MRRLAQWVADVALAKMKVTKFCTNERYPSAVTSRCWYHKHRAESCLCPRKNTAGRDDFTARWPSTQFSPPSDLVQGVAMSTSVVYALPLLVAPLYKRVTK